MSVACLQGEDLEAKQKEVQEKQRQLEKSQVFYTIALIHI